MEEIRTQEIGPLEEKMLNMQEIIEKSVIKKDAFHDMVNILSNISFKVGIFDVSTQALLETIQFSTPACF